MSPAFRAYLNAGLAGLAGALAARAVGLPAPDLIGPALVAVAVGARGVAVDIPARWRDAAFLILGVAIGGGVTPAAVSEAARWPMSLAALAAALVATQVASAALLRRWRRFDPPTAVMAACPGHMSFILGLSVDAGGDVRAISVIHAVRVLLLTLGAPFLAVLAFGGAEGAGPTGARAAAAPAFLGLALASLAFGLWLKARKAPAPLMLGGLIVTGLANATGLAAGGPPEPLMTAAFVTMGVFIGSRFSGASRAAVTDDLVAGVALTLLACVAAGATALAVAGATGLAPALLFVAYAPGGLEAMAAVALMLDLDPAFVAAHHTARLLLLAAVIPLLLRRARRSA